MPLGMKVGLSSGDCVRWGPSPLPTKGVEPPPQFSAHVYCGQAAGWIKMPLGMKVGLRAGDFVLDGGPAPSQKGGGARGPIFRPCLLWRNGWMDQDGTWHGGRPWSRPHCARWRPSSPGPKKGQSPRFSAHLYCGQTAGYIKMPLGTEVGLGLRDSVFDVDPANPRKRHTHSHPILGLCLLWSNGWMDEKAAWYGSRPRRRPHCTRRGPSSRERAQHPLFSAHVYCGHGRPSQLLLSSCYVFFIFTTF